MHIIACRYLSKILLTCTVLQCFCQVNAINNTSNTNESCTQIGCMSLENSTNRKTSLPLSINSKPVDQLNSNVSETCDSQMRSHNEDNFYDQYNNKCRYDYEQCYNRRVDDYLSDRQQYCDNQNDDKRDKRKQEDEQNLNFKMGVHSNLDKQVNFLLLVTTFDGQLSGISVKINKFKYPFIKLKQQWKLKLIKGPVFEADMDSSTFYFEDEALTFIPSLQGGIFTMQGSEIHAMPFTTDYLLDTSFQPSENSTVIGTKKTEIIKVDVTNGRIIYRSNFVYSRGTSRKSNADPVRKQTSSDLSSDSEKVTNTLPIGKPSDTSSLSGMKYSEGQTDVIQTSKNPNVVVFKLVTRKVRSVDINACYEKWFFKVVDINCKSTVSSCNEDFLKYANSSLKFNKDNNNEEKAAIFTTLENLKDVLNVSVAEGLVCVSTWPKPTQRGQNSLPLSESYLHFKQQQKKESKQQCINFNSSLIRAWFTMIKDRNAPLGVYEKPICIEELNILKMSSTENSDDRNSVHNYDKSDSRIYDGYTDNSEENKDNDDLKELSSNVVDMMNFTRADMENKKTTTDVAPNYYTQHDFNTVVKKESVENSSNLKNTKSPIMYIGKTLAKNYDTTHTYMLISDSDMKNMINRAKHIVSSESLLLDDIIVNGIGDDASNTAANIAGVKKSQGITSKHMLFSKLYHAHQIQHQLQQQQQKSNPIAIAILHDPTAKVVNVRHIIIDSKCCAIELYCRTGNNIFTFSAEINNKNNSNLVELMPYNIIDGCFTFCVCTLCLMGVFFTVLSIEATVFLCGVLPAIRASEFITDKVEGIMYFICICLVNIWAKQSLTESQFEFIQYFANVNLTYGPASTRKEFQRWIFVKLITNLWIDFPSRYESEYRHVRCLGIGGFGVVFEAINRLDHRHVAVKRIMLTNTLEHEILQEVRFLAQLNHPHVVYYHCGWFEVPPRGWQRERDKVLINMHIRDKDEIGESEQESKTSINSNSSHHVRQSNSSEMSISEQYYSRTKDLGMRRCSKDEITYQPLERSPRNDSLEIVFNDNDNFFNNHDYNNDENDVNSNSSSTDLSDEHSSGSINEITDEVNRDYYQTNYESDSVNVSYSSESQRLYEIKELSTNMLSNSPNLIGIEYNVKNGSYDLADNRHNTLNMHCCISDNRVQYPAEGKDDKITQRLSKESPGYLYFCMELCQPDTLRDWLEYHNTKERSLSDALWYFIQICKGVNHIHESGFVHRDLKPSNILFSRYDNNIVKIGDFGLMVRLEDQADAFSQHSKVTTDLEKNPKCDDKNDAHYHVVGTELYISPEQFSNPSLPISQYIDIYSLGIILFELLYPFSTNMERVMTLRCLRDLCGSTSDSRKLKNLSSGTKEFLSYSYRETSSLSDYECTNPLEWTIIKWLLSRDPMDRPTAKELLDCPIFIELAFRYLDGQRFDSTGWRRARCTSSSQTMPY